MGKYFKNSVTQMPKFWRDSGYDFLTQERFGAFAQIKGFFNCCWHAYFKLPVLRRFAKCYRGHELEIRSWWWLFENRRWGYSTVKLRERVKKLEEQVRQNYCERCRTAEKMEEIRAWARKAAS